MVVNYVPRVKKPVNKFSALIRDIVQHKALYIMLLPGLALILLLSYLPMLGALVAFKDFKYLGNNFFENFMLSKWVGFTNFEFFLKGPDTWLITRNTIGYNLAFIILGNIIAITFSLGLNELLNKKVGRFYQSAMLLPYFLSWIVMSYLFYGFLSVDRGILNVQILQPLGIKTISWYSDTTWWPLILIAANVLKYAGYNSIIYLATLTGIDEELYEAAILDGATKWQQIVNITLPLLSNVIIILLLFSVGRIFVADLGLFYYVPMLSGPLFPVTQVLDTYVYRALMNSGDIGMSSAAGLYQSMIGFILVLLANFAVRKIDPDKALF
ncbi:MAG TPA: ABC transporter permease subunit [Clostridiaceae bacterium]